MEGFLLYSQVSISECWPVPRVNNNYLDKACVRQVYQHKSRDGGEPYNYQCTSEDESVLKQLTSKLKTSLARQAGDKTS